MEIIKTAIPYVNLCMKLLLLLLVIVKHYSVSAIYQLKPLPFLVLRSGLPLDFFPRLLSRLTRWQRYTFATIFALIL
jgi:hypothetical protein